MKHRAKTYSKFINEAYIDPEGRLQDLRFTQNDRDALEMVDHINQIRDFLEDSGATRVRIGDPSSHPIVFKFEYGSRSYFMELDLDQDQITIHAKSPRSGIPHEIYQDSAQGFFDLAMNTGLDFLLF
jgi:hypothetical protein